MRDTSINTTGLKNVTRGLIDRSIASLTGSSQTLMEANPIRKRFIFKNGAASVGLNLKGTTAVIGGADTVTLLAYEGIALSGKDCPKGAITVIGTSTNYVSAYEGQ